MAWPRNDVVDNVDLVTAAHVNSIVNAVKTWEGNVSGNGYNLSGVAALTVTGAIAAASVAATGAITAASVAATGAITAASVTATGALTAASVVSSGAIGGAAITGTALTLNVAAGDIGEFRQIGGVNRWGLYSSNGTGHDLQLLRYNDAGAYQDVPLWIRRSTGHVWQSVSASPNLATANNMMACLWVDVSVGFPHAIKLTVKDSAGTITTYRLTVASYTQP
jgi:hypothetical protein